MLRDIVKGEAEDVEAVVTGVVAARPDVLLLTGIDWDYGLAALGALEARVEEGVPVKHVTRHVLGLFQGLPGAKHWRRYLSENAHVDDRNSGILVEALAAMTAVRDRQLRNAS